MSPSSQGVVPGLFLALVAALTVLYANNHWLFPALDETGVRYLESVASLDRGEPVRIPIAEWDADQEWSGLEGHGTLVPATMAVVVRLGLRAHVAALWVMAASAAAAVFFLSWTVGGVAGIRGATAAGLTALASTLTVDAFTTVGPDLTLTALVMLLLGVMTYQPRWSGIHGVVAALAWLAHPAGVAAVAGATLWPLLRWRNVRERTLLAAAGLAPAGVLILGGLMRPLLMPSLPAPASPSSAIGGVLGWAGTGFGGPWATGAGGLLLLALALLAAREGATTPRPPVTVHWSDPAAYDLLAGTFRPLVGLLVLCTAVGATLGTPGELARPWLPTTFLLAGLAAATAARWALRVRRPRPALPGVALAAWVALSGWASWAEFASMREQGKGITAAVWVESDVVRWIDNRSRAHPRLYASDPALVLLHSGRGSRRVPSVAEGLDAFAAHLREHPGAVVLSGSDAEATARALRRWAPLEQAISVPEGIVLLPRP